MRMTILILLGLMLARGFADEKKPAFTAEQVAFYEKEVLPILKENCLKCHGEKKFRGGLSLTSRAAILKGGDSGPAWVHGKVATSPIVRAVRYSEGLEMPPSGKLPQKKIDVLVKWADMGLPFTPGKDEVVKAHDKVVVTDADREWWAYRPLKRPAVPATKGGPVDAFVRAKLDAAGLAMNPPAGRLALIRRAYYDLIGLPPTPDEVDAFVKDERPDAYERLVERLLSSPGYGERWGRHWLDLVRYAETHGYERDSAKPFAWRYRDYVVRSFNANKPYDRFVMEQLAGDSLPGADAETLTATGYYRLGIWDDEPADRLQAKYDVLDGVVSTTSNVFLGMTVGCARCHDHKKDPIPQKDYYRLLAVFRDVTDMNRENLRRVMTTEEQKKHDAALKARQEENAKRFARAYALEQKFLAAVKASGTDLSDLSYRYYRDAWHALPDFEAVHPLSSGKVAGRIALSVAPKKDNVGLVFEGKLRVPAAGEYTFEIESSDGARLILDGKRVVDRPGKGKATATGKAKLAAGMVPLRLEYFNTTTKPELSVHWSGPGVERRALSGDDKPADLEALLAKDGERVLGPGDLRELRSLRREINRRAKEPAPAFGTDVMCVAENGRSVATTVLIRGNPHAPGDVVTAAAPEVLGGQAFDGNRRRQLAEWIVDVKNPIAARTMANRVWQYHFGRGIAPTTNDFGKLGEAPTHPEMLDWLAVELMESGWDLKHLHRVVMLSDAYRQSSAGRPEALAKDGGNNLLWRYTVRRLHAEEVRDSVLSVTGDLNRNMEGPPVYPTIPPAVLAGQSVPGAGWGKSPPREQARRSVYVHVKRSLLLPILETHDAADTDSSCAARYTTTVPTQALGMLNGEFTNEQAAKLAARLQLEAKGVEHQVRRAVRLTTGRTASDEEVRADAAFIARLVKEDGLTEERALAMYCLLALNANEFVYVD